jgi:hypothetical protein
MNNDNKGGQEDDNRCVFVLDHGVLGLLAILFCRRP